MKIYVACPLNSILRAQGLARTLTHRGHTIASTWHTRPSSTIEDERHLTRDQERAIADLCLLEIASADRLVVMWQNNGRCGHLFEAAFAVGQGMRVDAFPVYGGDLEDGKLPTILLRSRFVHSWRDEREFLAKLGGDT